jgi:hypothetical protein
VRENMITVYVAGAYSADNVLDVFGNMRRGMRACMELIYDNFSPFCPFLDYQYSLLCGEDNPITLEMYYQYSLAQLRRQETMLVLPGSERSVGVANEVTEAARLHIPTFFNRESLRRYRDCRIF